MRKKIVAVSQRIDYFPDRAEERDALDRRLILFLLQVGLLPIPVPNCLHGKRATGNTFRQGFETWIEQFKPEAFVLSGGNNIGDYPDRDLTETWLLDYARDHHLPALGICRGMQMMAVWAGETLEPAIGHVGTRHRLSGDLSREVNSFHNLVVRNCPSNFRVIARAEDGAIEAIRHRTLPLEGWMWHPEREDNFARADIKRIEALFYSN